MALWNSHILANLYKIKVVSYKTLYTYKHIETYFKYISYIIIHFVYKNKRSNYYLYLYIARKRNTLINLSFIFYVVIGSRMLIFNLFNFVHLIRLKTIVYSIKLCLQYI